jgi:phage tail-like protein
MATNQPAKGSTRNDPLPVFCFKVKLDTVPEEAFFKSVSGLKVEIETVPVREGGQNATTFQLVGATKWSNIVLKRGFTKDSGTRGMLNWCNGWIGQAGVRSGGVITLLDTALTPQAQWTFHNGIPVKWDIGEFDASKSELAIETLEIAHEGITYTALNGQ